MITKKFTLIDAHAHLDQVESLPESLREAKEQGVSGIVSVGMDVESNIAILDIARENPGYVFSSLGYHPWSLCEAEIDENIAFIREHTGLCVAIGEIGLDYKIKTRKALQQKVFGTLLDLAKEKDKPVILHCRFSHAHAFKMLREIGIERAVFHWYSGPVDLLKEILDHGYFVSATPALRYSPPHQEAIRLTPIGQLLLETDSPVVYQGLRAEPKHVSLSLDEVAKIKGLDRMLVSRETTANAVRFFGLTVDGLQLPGRSDVSEQG